MRRRRLRARHDVPADREGEIFLCRAMLDQTDDRIRPRLRVFDRQVEAVEAKKMPQRFERRTLVALLNRVSLRDAGHEPHGEDDNVILTVGERILRARQRAFEKTKIANEVVFSGYLDL